MKIIPISYLHRLVVDLWAWRSDFIERRMLEDLVMSSSSEIKIASSILSTGGGLRERFRVLKITIESTQKHNQNRTTRLQGDENSKSET